MNNIPSQFNADEGTQGWIRQSVDETLLNLVDNMIIDNVEYESQSQEGTWIVREFNAPIYNSNKHPNF